MTPGYTRCRSIAQRRLSLGNVQARKRSLPFVNLRKEGWERLGDASALLALALSLAPASTAVAQDLPTGTDPEVTVELHGRQRSRFRLAMPAMEGDELLSAEMAQAAGTRACHERSSGFRMVAEGGRNRAGSAEIGRPQTGRFSVGTTHQQGDRNCTRWRTPPKSLVAQKLQVSDTSALFEQSQ